MSLYCLKRFGSHSIASTNDDLITNLKESLLEI